MFFWGEGLDICFFLKRLGICLRDYEINNSYQNQNCCETLFMHYTCISVIVIKNVGRWPCE